MADLAIAANRFGLGARPDDRADGDARAALRAQFDRFEPRPAAYANAPTRATIAGELADYLEAIRANRGAAAKAEDAAAPDPQKAMRQLARVAGRDAYVSLVGARVSSALVTPAPFVERLVHFWANHFAISADKLTVVGMGGLLEAEAIRPHVLGKFSDMVRAVEQHPAMLLYLDQAQSIGPDSFGGQIAARRNAARKLGLNENLAREIMELHTLGVRTGYTQEDVTEFARALTGWTVAGIARGPGQRLLPSAPPGDFVFAEALHQPGTRMIMGQRFAAAGQAQGQAVLDMLAAHPATARHIATKLARHFAGDVPPPALVERLAERFTATGGDLKALYAVLIEAPEVWAAAPRFKSPWDWSISAMRGIGLREVQPQAAAGMMTQLGQPVWRPGSPAGFDDLDASWAGPDALVRRVEAAGRIAARAGSEIDARALGDRILPGRLSAASKDAIARCESPSEGLALLLVSPEFLRR